MKEYIVTATFTNGRTIIRKTANQLLAQHFMIIFTECEKVTNVQIKLIHAKDIHK